MSTTGDYEPLPQRRAGRRRDRPAAAVSATESGGDDEQPQQKVLVLAPQSLQARDGCAGEFYEYLDHTADVQLHAWGTSLLSAFENIVPCMFNYMTDIATVHIDVDKCVEFTVSAHDLHSLLYAYLDEFLYRFSTDGFCCKEAKVLHLNKESFSITVRG